MLSMNTSGCSDAVKPDSECEWSKLIKIECMFHSLHFGSSSKFCKYNIVNLTYVIFTAGLVNFTQQDKNNNKKFILI